MTLNLWLIGLPKRDNGVYDFQQSVMTVVPRCICLVITSLNVCWVRSGTGSKKRDFVPRWMPPRIHWPSIIQPLLCWRCPNLASSISTIVSGPPKGDGLFTLHKWIKTWRIYEIQATTVVWLYLSCDTVKSWWGGGSIKKYRTILHIWVMSSLEWSTQVLDFIFCENAQRTLWSSTERIRWHLHLVLEVFNCAGCWHEVHTIDGGNTWWAIKNSYVEFVWENISNAYSIVSSQPWHTIDTQGITLYCCLIVWIWDFWVWFKYQGGSNLRAFGVSLENIFDTVRLSSGYLPNFFIMVNCLFRAL